MNRIYTEHTEWTWFNYIHMQRSCNPKDIKSLLTGKKFHTLTGNIMVYDSSRFSNYLQRYSRKSQIVIVKDIKQILDVFL